MLDHSAIGGGPGSSERVQAFNVRPLSYRGGPLVTLYGRRARPGGAHLVVRSAIGDIPPSEWLHLTLCPITDRKAFP